MTANYPDWLNPMLVKELRQGLNKGMFTGVFILVQLAMILFVGMRLLTTDGEVDQNIGSYMDGLLKGGLGLIILFVLPLRGLAAIQEEKKLQTLELVQVTRLGSRRIVWGKWAAIMSQILLFIVAVLPYGVLRYFLGGMEIMDTFISLGNMLLMSMVMSAFCVWLSAMGPAIRAIAIVVLVMGFQYFTVMSVSLMGSGRGLGLGSYGPVGVIFSAVVTTVFLLAMAASQIASVAENHSVVLRGIALVTGLASLLGTLLGNPEWAALGVPVMVWAMIMALTEQTSEVPSMYAPWLAWGLPGRLAARVFNPGWASGMLFSLGITALLACLDYITSIGAAKDLSRSLLVFGLCYLALITPVCILTTSMGAKNRGVLYFLFQALFTLVMVVGNILPGPDRTAFIDSLTPTSAAIWALGHRDKVSDPHWLKFVSLTVPIGIVILLFLLWRSIREFRLMSKQEAKVARKLS